MDTESIVGFQRDIFLNLHHIVFSKYTVKIMSEKIASIIGSTGMIGIYLQEQLLQDNYFDTVRVLVRRPQEKTNEKLEVKLINFDDAESVKIALEGSDTIFSCIGTTQRNVKGDKELYRKIDFEIPANTARWGKEIGCKKWVMITSVNANPASSTFYLKLKG
ncbi:MAG: NAD-dependent epimerase/dehydratase family protein, partial [Chitinophagaceae bacterium]